MTLNKTIVEEQAEAPQLFANTSSTGKRYGQAFGYVANGFFQKSDDLNGDGVISAAEMKQQGYPVQNFTTVYPGDVKYVDLTGDDNDRHQRPQGDRLQHYSARPLLQLPPGCRVQETGVSMRCSRE